MKIAEAAQKTNVTPVTLRYYEKVGLIPPIERKDGIRNYSEADINWIGFIRCMRQVRIPVNDLLEYTKLVQKGTDTRKNRRAILVKELEKLEQENHNIQQTITRLKTKITLYDQGKIK